MNQSRINPKIVRAAVLAFFVLLVGGVLYFVATHSYIDVTSKGAKDATVELYSIQGKKATVINTKDGHVKRFVAKGAYDVTVTSGETSYLQAVTAGGFFTSTNVEATLKPENLRTFIGDDPSNCMAYEGTILITNDCAGPYTTQKSHVQATNTTPTYTVTSAINATLEGLIKTGEGTLVMLNRPFSDLDAVHSVYTLTADKSGTAQPSATNDLSTLDQNKTYKILPYKTGFITYDDSYSEVNYYGSLASVDKPQKLTITTDDKTLTPGGINSQSDTGVVAIFSNITSIGSNDTLVKQKSDVVTTDGKDSQHYKFNSAYTNGLLCSKDMLCMQAGDQLDVYKLNGAKASLLYSVHGIKELVSVNKNQLIAVTKTGLLTLDVATKTGSYMYTFGGYKFGNVQANGGDYILSVLDARSLKSALLISPASPNTDSIDKKILALQKDPAVKKASLYKNLLFIVPEQGELVEVPDSNTFRYDPAFTKKSVSAINTVIDLLKIDRTKYKVTGI